MRGAVHKVDDLLKTIVERSDNEIKNYISFIDNTAYSIFVLVVFIALIIGILVSKSILSGIIQLKETMIQVMN